MKKVVICGSRPQPVIFDDADHIFFINGSISQQKNYKHVPTHTHVITRTGIRQILDTLEDPSAPQKKKEKSQFRIEQICSGAPDTTVFVDPGKTSESLSYLKRNGYRTDQVVSLDTREKIDIIKSTSGLKFPFANPANHETNLPKKAKKTLYLLKDCYRIRFTDYRTGNPLPSAMPSNGVFALAYAIATHGDSATFQITGISFSDGPYYYERDGSRFYVKKKRLHLSADINILSALSRHYRVSVDCPEGAKETKTPLFQPSERK